MKFWTALFATTAIALPLTAASAQPIDGLYIGGGGGINLLQRQDLTLSTPSLSRSGSVRSDPGAAAVLSLGWGFGNGIRAEIEGSYRQNNGFTNPNGYGGPGRFGGREQKAGAMANVLYDFVGVVPYMQPYAGLGVGYQQVIEQNLGGDLPAPVGHVTSTANSRGSLAYQAIVGASMPIYNIPGLAVTAEYRFMGLAVDRQYPVTIGGVAGRATSTDNYNHAILIGLRYAFGAPLAAAAVPASMPLADNGAKTFLVFFDWNRSDLTGRSEGIVREAATYATRTHYVRIDVDGNADTSGSSGYNQGLSERRAKVVAAELVRDGVPDSAIAMHAFGDTKLLVATGPNVREPQNRRVEIVFH